jgi:hypothetical protein
MDIEIELPGSAVKEPMNPRIPEILQRTLELTDRLPTRDTSRGEEPPINDALSPLATSISPASAVVRIPRTTCDPVALESSNELPP